MDPPPLRKAGGFGLYPQGLLHPVAGEGGADDFVGVVGDIAHVLVERDLVLAAFHDGGPETEFPGPCFRLLDDARAQPLVPILRQHDDPPEDHVLRVEGVEPAGGYGQVIIDNNDVFGVRRIMLVELHLQRNLVLPRHRLDADIVRPGLLRRFRRPDDLHQFLSMRGFSSVWKMSRAMIR